MRGISRWTTPYESSVRDLQTRWERTTGAICQFASVINGGESKGGEAKAEVDGQAGGEVNADETKTYHPQSTHPALSSRSTIPPPQPYPPYPQTTNPRPCPSPPSLPSASSPAYSPLPPPSHPEVPLPIRVPILRAPGLANHPTLLAEEQV